MKIEEINTSMAINFINDEAISNYQTLKNASERFIGYPINNAQGVGLFAVYGALGKGFWDASLVAYQDIQSGIEAMLNDESIKEIVLLLDSPGGSCVGLFSCCDYIKMASEIKPIHAFISGEACSAAYAIATSCTDVVIEKDSETGCCGAFAKAMEYDASYLKEKQGILSRIFRSKNAPKKNLSPITDEEAANELQERIDNLGAEYMALIASNRGLDVSACEETFGQGAVVSASYALEHGMVDGISDWSTFISGLSASSEDELLEDEDKESESLEDESKPSEDEKEYKDQEINNLNTNSSLSAEDKSEGADMDIVNMSAEDRAEAFKALIEADPSLLAQAKNEAGKAERERVMALSAMKNGVAEYDEIINKAISEGKCENDAKIELFDFMKMHPVEKAEKAVSNVALEALASADQPVNPVNSESDEFSLLMKKVEEARK